ncbi:ABC transporter ATP-binding protein [Clostridium kluyveri]|uniref:Peptide ABC transporter ATP-binding protein n=1 Tax=Clostridium kluyveri TaxID=1534 RepID=A0A1L5F9B2_CLOKL|nr:ABC transporter ATP-binding protein [Clostridium kluyveri]APM39606.1 peptide ABC transporter ATP-binding protein [Clostridium kluyveri]UZQ50240.1 ABC transporter ATP-binding protein [Clostridium kluyveri]
MSCLLSVRHLQTAFKSNKKEVISVEDVSFDINSGETVGVVGESGCGKSVTSLSIMRLLGKKGYIRKGEIKFNNKDIVKLDDKGMREIRGNKISMIFQEPMTSLNPLFTIGNQITEVIKLHQDMDYKETEKYAVNMLNLVGIPRANKIINDYPHTLSGGMRQRVMIAMALCCKPELLIADEPTTALDVTIQAQILDLIKKLRKEMGMSVMLITHDLGVVAEMADKVIVMYAGQVVEEADVFTLFDHPKHPYTSALIKSIPQIDLDINKRLETIRGMVPSTYQNIVGCRFHNRCPYASERCINEAPALNSIADGHKVRCFLVKSIEEVDKEAI